VLIVLRDDDDDDVVKETVLFTVNTKVGSGELIAFLGEWRNEKSQKERGREPKKLGIGKKLCLFGS